MKQILNKLFLAACLVMLSLEHIDSQVNIHQKNKSSVVKIPNKSKTFNLPTNDTVLDLNPFLVSKVDCDFIKSVDENSCILVKYKDGLIKRICNGKLTEVITPDGRRHILRNAPVLYHEVMAIPFPPNPSASDDAYIWLKGYSQNLLSQISDELLHSNQQEINMYTSREQARCNNNIFKEIDFRVTFIEQFLKAK